MEKVLYGSVNYRSKMFKLLSTRDVGFLEKIEPVLMYVGLGAGGEFVFGLQFP